MVVGGVAVGVAVSVVVAGAVVVGVGVVKHLQQNIDQMEPTKDRDTV